MLLSFPPVILKEIDLRSTHTIMSATLTYHEMRLVKATIPKLRESGETITTTMYGSMLKDHPELNNMFNTVNQV